MDYYICILPQELCYLKSWHFTPFCLCLLKLVVMLDYFLEFQFGILLHGLAIFLSLKSKNYKRARKIQMGAKYMSWIDSRLFTKLSPKYSFSSFQNIYLYWNPSIRMINILLAYIVWQSLKYIFWFIFQNESNRLAGELESNALFQLWVRFEFTK